MGNEQGRVLSSEELRAREIGLMDSEVKKRLGQAGMKYNIKVVIKGDRNTGKTCLWRRLQGLSFTEEYIPTPEIQIAHINWSYKASDDVVKVEVWDVVDKAKPKKRSGIGNLKVSYDEELDEANSDITLPPPSTQQGSFAVSALDANTVDVMKGAHAVIIMVDPTKKWTWDYAQREVAKIPKDIYILILMNYRDMGEHRVVTEYEVKSFCQHSEGGHTIKTLESSMLNGYGLRAVVSFFNIPFLCMQRQYIQSQLDRNMEEIHSAEAELKMITAEQGYDFYMKWLESQKRKPLTRSTSQADTTQHTTAPTQTAASTRTTAQPPPPSSAQTTTTTTLASPRVVSQPPPPPQQEHAKKTVSPPQPSAPPPQPFPQNAPTPAAKPPAKPAEAPAKSFFSRMFGGGSKPQQPEKVEPVAKPPATQAPEKPPSVDEFNTGDLDGEFFSDDLSTSVPKISPFGAPSPQASPIMRSKTKTVHTGGSGGGGGGRGGGKGDFYDEEDRPNPLVAKDQYGSDDEDAPNPLVTKDESVDEDAFSTPISRTSSTKSVSKKGSSLSPRSVAPADPPPASKPAANRPVSPPVVATPTTTPPPPATTKKSEPTPPPSTGASPTVKSADKNNNKVETVNTNVSTKKADTRKAPPPKKVSSNLDDSDNEDSPRPSVMQDEDFDVGMPSPPLPVRKKAPARKRKPASTREQDFELDAEEPHTTTTPTTSTSTSTSTKKSTTLDVAPDEGNSDALDDFFNS